MTVARLRGSTLTSNASYQSVDYTWSNSNISISSIAQDDIYTCHVVLTLNTPVSENRYYLEYANIITSVSGGSDLEYYIKHRYSGTTLVESDWQPVGTPIYLPTNLSNYDGATSLLFYVRRVDSQPLRKDDISNITGVYAKGFYNNEIVYPTQTTAIPPDWLDNTTQTYQTVTTVTRPTDYDNLIGTVPSLAPDVGGTPPHWFEQFNPLKQDWFLDIITSLDGFSDIVATISAYMKIFWVFGGFVITGLLLAWLLH